MELSSTLAVLTATALGLAVFHTAVGPDHYLPFIVLGRAEGWSLRKTMAITVACGLGHVLSSIAIGAIGIAIGWSVVGMEAFEGLRGEIASTSLIGFGLVYMVWGLWRARRGHVHAHVHADGTEHAHGHAHEHDEADHDESPHVRAHRRTFWALFVVFVLGPCEPLIPLLMVPASQHSGLGIVLVASVFALATVGTMTLIVAAGLAGLRLVRFRGLARWAHAASGAAIATSGLAIAFLGL